MAMPGQLMFARRLGPTARLTIWLMIGLSCVVVDVRYHALDGLRSGFSMLLQPVREVMRVPTNVAAELTGFFTRHRLLQKQRDALLVERAQLMLDVSRGAEMARENAELRALLKLQSSEVTLVSNTEQLTPVFVERTGQRGLAAGTGHGQMELRYMSRRVIAC